MRATCRRDAKMTSPSRSKTAPKVARKASQKWFKKWSQNCSKSGSKSGPRTIIPRQKIFFEKACAPHDQLPGAASCAFFKKPCQKRYLFYAAQNRSKSDPESAPESAQNRSKSGPETVPEPVQELSQRYIPMVPKQMPAALCFARSFHHSPEARAVFYCGVQVARITDL